MHTYRVTANERLTPSTIRVTLKPDKRNKRPFMFAPGQYAAISFIRHRRPSVARCFSIVSSPTETDKLQFSMRTHGHYTSALAKMSVGDVVRVRGPYGGFVYDPERHGDSMLIAGGIGITPFMSMVKYATDIKTSRRIELLYAVQSQDDMPFHAELDDLAKYNQNLDITYAVSHGSIGAIKSGNVISGHIDEELIRSKLIGTSKTVFICGPPPFMKGMVKILHELGVSRHQIITEAFNQGALRQTGKVASWPQNMYILGAFGVGLGSVAVMVGDIVKTLPNVPLGDGTAVSLQGNGQREKDLDTLVNGLKEDLNRPDSPTVSAAQQAANDAVLGTSSQSTTTTQTTTPTTTPTPAPAPAPAPAQPVCTTSQSGVVTCY